MAKIIGNSDPLVEIKSFLKKNPGVEVIELEEDKEENPRKEVCIICGVDYPLLLETHSGLSFCQDHWKEVMVAFTKRGFEPYGGEGIGKDIGEFFKAIGDVFNAYTPRLTPTKVIRQWYNIAKSEVGKNSTAWNDFCAEMGHIPENVAHMTSAIMDFGEWLEKNRATEYNPEPDALTQTDAADFGHVDVILVTVQKEGHPDKVTLASQIFFDEEKQFGQYWLTEPFSKKRIVVQFTEKEIWEGRKALFQFIADGGNLRSVIENPSTMVQTILFDKRKWDEKSAKSWLKKHDFKIALEDYDTWQYMRARQERPGKFKRFRTRDITDGILFTFGVLGKKNPCKENPETTEIDLQDLSEILGIMPEEIKRGKAIKYKGETWKIVAIYTAYPDTEMVQISKINSCKENPSDIIYAKIVKGADSIILTPHGRNIYLLYRDKDDLNVSSGTLEEMIHEMNEFVNKYGWKWETKPRRDSHQENPGVYRIWVKDAEQDIPEYIQTNIFFHNKKEAESYANIETAAGMSEEFEARIHKGVLPKDANFEYED